MWNYIYYIQYINEVFPNDRNALEKQIFDKVRPLLTGWLAVYVHVY